MSGNDGPRRVIWVEVWTTRLLIACKGKLTCDRITLRLEKMPITPPTSSD